MLFNEFIVSILYLDIGKKKRMGVQQVETIANCTINQLNTSIFLANLIEKFYQNVTNGDHKETLTGTASL